MKSEPSVRVPKSSEIAVTLISVSLAEAPTPTTERLILGASATGMTVTVTVAWSSPPNASWTQYSKVSWLVVMAVPSITASRNGV
jgi:hypothetical protein